MAQLLPNLAPKFWDRIGSQLASGTAEFRDPSTDALVDVYPTADDAEAQTNALDNPLPLDISGSPATPIFIREGVAYKVILKSSSGGVVQTVDDIEIPEQLTPIPDLGAAAEYTNSQAGATTETIQSKLDETVSIWDYGAVPNGSTEASAAVQAAISSGARCIVFPPGEYRVQNQITVTDDDITLLGYGAKILGGGNMSDGANGLFEIDASGFRAFGLEFDMDRRVSCFRINPTAERRGFQFADIVSKDHFYVLKGGISGSSNYVHDIKVNNCHSVGPNTYYHGHYLFHSAREISVTNCYVRYGENASCYGFGTDCSGITVTDCIARDNADTQPSDASLQIENSPNANAVIVGNDFDHDIWVDDSSTVQIGPNKARKVRVTVQTDDSHFITAQGGTYGEILLDDFSTPSPGVTIDHFRAHGVELDPAAYSLSIGMFINGSVTERLRFHDIDMISNASTNNLQMTRNSQQDILFDNVDFNGGSLSIGGSAVGTLNARDCPEIVTKNQDVTPHTITSGSTSVTVNHGLSSNIVGSPEVGEIHITPAGSSTNLVSAFWVSNVTNTSFDVNVNTDPGASGWSFGWQVSRERVS